MFFTSASQGEQPLLYIIPLCTGTSLRTGTFFTFFAYTAVLYRRSRNGLPRLRHFLCLFVFLINGLLGEVACTAAQLLSQVGKYEDNNTGKYHATTHAAWDWGNKKLTHLTINTQDDGNKGIWAFTHLARFAFTTRDGWKRADHHSRFLFCFSLLNVFKIEEESPSSDSV